MGHRATYCLKAAAFLLVLPASGFPLLAQVPSPASSGAAAVPRSGTTQSIPIDQMRLSPSDLHAALFRAVLAGDVEMVRKLLVRGAAPGGGLLVKATQDGKAEIVRALLDAGASVDEKDDRTRTALMYAAREGHTEIARMLLAKGADPNARNEYPHVFTLHGPSPHLARDNHMSALMYAAQGGHTQIVAAFAAAGAKIEARSYYDETALMYAADKGRTETAVKLLELGADPQASADSREKKIEAQALGYSYGGTALDYAVRGKNPATAKALLAKQARGKPIENGESVFYYALFSGDLELVRSLAERGVDTRKAYFLPAAARGSSPEIFKFLLDRVPEAEIRGARLDPSILTSAADGKSLVKVQMVLERGANINGRDNRGQNALYYAVYQGAADVVEYLLDKGIEVNVTGDISLGTSNQGDTALAMAVQKGQLDMVKQLLAKGADVNLKRASGKSALDVAKEIGRTDVLLLLASSGRVPADSSPAYLRGKSIYRLPAKLEAGMQFRSGGLLYLANCADCHRADGTGNGGRKSLERLQGRTKPALIAALLQGVKAANFVAMEESQSRMLDAEIAAILGYMDQAWGGNPGHDFQPADVQALRTAAPTRAQDPVISSGDRAGAVLKDLGNLGYLYSESVFVEAVRMNDRKAVELFLAAGMNPAAKSAKGETASYVAAWNDNAEVLALLLDSGVDVHLKNAPWANGVAAPWAATEHCRGDKGNAMRVLLDKGLDPKYRQGDWTLLMRAASNGCVGTARILIERGADVNARLHGGQTALKLAKMYSGGDVIPVLIAAGAKE